MLHIFNMLAIMNDYIPIFSVGFEMVNTITEEKGKNTEEGDCEGDSLECTTKFCG